MSRFFIVMAVLSALCCGMSFLGYGTSVIVVAIVISTPAYIIGVGLARNAGLDVKNKEEITEKTDPFIRFKIFAICGLPIALAMVGASLYTEPLASERPQKTHEHPISVD